MNGDAVSYRCPGCSEEFDHGRKARRHANADEPFRDCSVQDDFGGLCDWDVEDVFVPIDTPPL